MAGEGEGNSPTVSVLPCSAHSMQAGLGGSPLQGPAWSLWGVEGLGMAGRRSGGSQRYSGPPDAFTASSEAGCLAYTQSLRELSGGKEEGSSFRFLWKQKLRPGFEHK